MTSKFGRISVSKNYPKENYRSNNLFHFITSKYINYSSIFYGNVKGMIKRIFTY
ncbi:hypothetical protein XBJ1_1206 [Xenorhabdus bovienii SS-2004]|uniref:Uncharacterized protein n=1 Tax=Xenorhabdus bovienii (strain SS-2004) TaxID=406818 RepID=D3UXG4_XENBS|nr:hypothetical protein XBJ1_1206 [Xenorhabdus bovienii SS-2004]